MQEVRIADESETDRAKIKVMDFFESQGFWIRLVVVQGQWGQL